MCTRIILSLFLCASINLFSQNLLKRDNFFPPSKAFPANYKAIVGDPKGWRAMGHYDLHSKQIDLKLRSWDSLSVYTPFKEERMYSKIRRHKIIGKGDKRVVSKMIYVDETILILQHKCRITRHGKNKTIKMRSLYSRRV